VSNCASCGGTIEDGYCTTCGLAAAVPSAPSVPSVPSVPSASASSVSSVGSRSSTSRRSGSRRASRRSARGRLGAGLVDIPPVPHRDPATAVLANPEVPESRRYCGSCEQPVGRGRDGRPGLTEGFCRNCGTQFSFRPKLVPGDLLAGQYEVLGCLAFGGLGWIYLAKDHNVSDRWVVLKGLLNTGDADAMAAAVAERQFLAQVEHPNIVRIYNFVQYDGAGYIVMEYVGGKSLKEVLQEDRRSGGSIPVEYALAYAIEVLPALGYLHDRGLVYCDFKPDNVIQTEEQLKLIDMGGVRAIDGDGAIYGTVGYQAPEIEADGPSISSDLYTVGRALAVMTFEFRYQGEFKFTFPDNVPVLQQNESFHRLLQRATNHDPDRRFVSAGEMADQLTGVLREVLALADGTQRPAFSTVFSPELVGIGTSDGNGVALAIPTAAQIVNGLPIPQVDRADPAAGYLATFAGLDAQQRADALSRAVSGDGSVPPQVAASPETRLALVASLLEAGDPATAGGVLGDLAAEDPLDWRIAWYDGLRRLLTATDNGQSAAAARGAFEAVYNELPGELAPKLALAFALEAAGDAAGAQRYFRLVWTVDRGFMSAAFGLARTSLAAGDRPGAIAALAAVPESSSHHAAAQIAAVRILVSPGVTGEDLRRADGTLGRLSLDEVRRQELTVEVLRAALDWASNGPRSAGSHPPAGPILGCEPNERALRFGLERGYRALAKLTSDHQHKIELVDLANAVRPRTWV
jgi:serine/threonine-protein kinase PknG